MNIDDKITESLRAALREDIGSRDLTSSVIPPALISKADCIFKEQGVLAGIVVCEQVFRLVDEDIRFLPAAKDGEIIESGRVIFYVEGKLRSILAAERTVLNFLSRMSGIATRTREFTDKVKGTSAKIYDTRKTTPLLRPFDRYAVSAGGGSNHRSGLYDGVLLKDNHLKAMPSRSYKDILRDIRSKVTKKIPIGIEVENIGEYQEALACDFHYILLDGFTVEEVSTAVKLKMRVIPPPLLEVSGNVSLNNVRDYAKCGVERISVGQLTHSVKSIDASLNIIL